MERSFGDFFYRWWTLIEIFGELHRIQHCPKCSEYIIICTPLKHAQLHYEYYAFFLVLGNGESMQKIIRKITKVIRIFRIACPGEIRHAFDWGRVTHICVNNLTIIGSDNGLSPDRCQAIFWTNAGLLLIIGTIFNEILITIQQFSFTKMRLKMSSAKFRTFRLGRNVLMFLHNQGFIRWTQLIRSRRDDFKRILTIHARLIQGLGGYSGTILWNKYVRNNWLSTTDIIFANTWLKLVALYAYLRLQCGCTFSCF